MGHSPSISDMMKKEKAFREWLETQQQALEAREGDLQKVQNKAIGTFYSVNNYDDSKSLGGGSSTDFQHQSDFTMKNLKKVIDAIGNAMFSDSAAPGGVTTDPAEAKQAVAAAKSLGGEVASEANLELYIASKVFDVLSEVIMAFGTSTKLSYTHTYKSVSLGYGMQLFCTVAADSQESHGFFTDETIFEYLYIYEVRFSEKQAKDEGERSLVTQYENAIAAFESRLKALFDEVQSGKLSGQQYEDQSNIWKKLITQNNDALQSMKAETYKHDLALH